MWSADEVLDLIAGPIDAPASWRMQFWICVTFNRWSVTMLEEDNSGAAAYLWILSGAQANAIGVQSDVSKLGEHPFDVQDACELSPSQALHWNNWPFFRVGDEIEEVAEQERDGIWMTMRSFNSSLTGPMTARK